MPYYRYYYHYYYDYYFSFHFHPPSTPLPPLLLLLALLVRSEGYTSDHSNF